MIDLTGKVVSLSRDFRTRKPVISIMTEEEDLSSLEEMGDKLLSLRISKKSEKRSLDSNAYFHVLCDKLRQKVGISMTRCKNLMITSYGQVDYLDDGTQIVIKTNITPDEMLEVETLHAKAVKVEIQNDKEVTYYRIYRGSHTYNSEEMSKLISGTIEECRQQGIETATPEELARMAALWREKHGQQAGKEQ